LLQGPARLPVSVHRWLGCFSSARRHQIDASCVILYLFGHS
jgi:hypothetical protein